MFVIGCMLALNCYGRRVSVRLHQKDVFILATTLVMIVIYFYLQKISNSQPGMQTTSQCQPIGGSRGGTGGLDIINIRFLCNTGPDPMIITKLTSKHLNFGHHWHASETTFKLRLLAGR